MFLIVIKIRIRRPADARAPPGCPPLGPPRRRPSRVGRRGRQPVAGFTARGSREPARKGRGVCVDPRRSRLARPAR
jgi:hypothetical protein